MGIQHHLGSLLVPGWCWDSAWQVLSSNCCCRVCRVFLALVAEAVDRGCVVAQGGGKVS